MATNIELLNFNKDYKSNDKVKLQLDRWKKSLIDFSKRNQLLFFKPRPTLTVSFENPSDEIFKKLILESKNLSLIEKVQAFSMDDFGSIPVDPDELEPGMSFDDVLADEPVIDAVQNHDFENSLQTDKDRKNLDQSLAKLKLRSAASLQEQGVNILYFALYFLNWNDSNSAEDSESFYKSPLLLVPAHISRKGLNGDFTLSAIEDEIRINPTLAYKLSRDYDLDLYQFEDELNNCEDLEEFQTLIEKIRAFVSKDHKKWQIIDESAISLFSFAKLSLYKDLEVNEEKIINHHVIRQISGEILNERELARNIDLKYLVKANEIDIKLDPHQSNQILDADSSQEEAIYAAKAGASFVIQGPPGTGKSQTIANIIAESLAQNKKVLFVSEKKAALEVVINRLKASNLDKYCLELHNSQKKKSDVIDSLRTSLEEIKNLAMENSREEYIDDINKVKAEILRTIDELHRIRKPINMSLYELYGELARLNLEYANSKIDFTIGNIEKINLEKLSEFDYFFKLLAAQERIITGYDSFLWRNANVANLSFELENSIKSNLIEFKSILTKLAGYANPLSQKYFARTTNNLSEFKWLAEASKLAINSPFPKKDWFNGSVLQNVQSLTIHAKIEHEEYSVDKQHLLSRYSENFLELDHNELLTKFTQKFTGIFRFLNIDYWQSVSQIKKYALLNESRDLTTIINDLQMAAELDRKNLELNKDGAQLSLVLGDFYKDFDTDWDETITAIKWVQKVMGKFNSQTLPEPLLNLVSDEAADEDFVSFEKQTKELLKAYELVKFHLDFYTSIFPKPNCDIETMSFNDLSNHLEDLIVNITDIEDWIEFKTLQAQARELGLGQFLSSLIEAKFKKIDAAQIKSIFHKKLYQSWVDKIEIENPVMRKFSGKSQEVLIEKFNNIDIVLVEKNKHKIAKKLGFNWIEYAANPIAKADMQVLNHEINKKKKHKPMRVLIKEIPDLLQTAKPCWMMSPLSVSQLIESDNARVEFDLVIFDEASQIRTEDAICSIYRAKQLILAGDSNQLPPTNFFNYINEDDDYENSSFESVLDECAVFLDSKTLNWHYRSRHEDLIKFSNYYIYDNQLITFPSPIAKSDDFGVDFELIEEGYYEKGSRFNRKEAQRVAEAILEHYSKNPDVSLGVIAFSEAQQFAIERELGKVMRADMTLQEKMQNHMDEEKTDSLFIKNLENVQGDERDVIFFSIGYARDKKGSLSHNFGPLNREGGHRRLNVAVTRARNKLKVFSSISSVDIDLSRTSAQGATLLKKYLAFAETCSGVLAKDDKANEVTDLVTESQLLLLGQSNINPYINKDYFGIEESIARSLEAQGYVVERFLGASDYKIDIAVRSRKNPDNYILAIETDGKIYRNAKTCRDRERLRKQVLTSLGWNTHKIWARDWIRNFEEEFIKLTNLLGNN
jgi:superfamily I DNA and/or RNA helicase